MNIPGSDLPRPYGPKSPVTLRTVTADEAGQRIDNFLMPHFKAVPRSRVYRLLRKGEVRVNRKRVDAEYKIAEGDEVRLPPVRIDAGDEAGRGGPGRPSPRLLGMIGGGGKFSGKQGAGVAKP